MNPYQHAEVYPKHKGMKCLTCNRPIHRKSECANHKGHEVVYVEDMEPSK